jgi:hypothetical protein
MGCREAAHFVSRVKATGVRLLVVKKAMSSFAPRKIRYFRGAKGDYRGITFLTVISGLQLPRSSQRIGTRFRL